MLGCVAQLTTSLLYDIFCTENFSYIKFKINLKPGDNFDNSVEVFSIFDSQF